MFTWSMFTTPYQEYMESIHVLIGRQWYVLFLPKSYKVMFTIQMFTLARAFSICSQSKKLECCKGFANIKGICEGKENIKNENAIFFIFY